MEQMVLWVKLSDASSARTFNVQRPDLHFTAVNPPFLTQCAPDHFLSQFHWITPAFLALNVRQHQSEEDLKENHFHQVFFVEVDNRGSFGSVHNNLLLIHQHLAIPKSFLHLTQRHPVAKLLIHSFDCPFNSLLHILHFVSLQSLYETTKCT